MLVDVFHPKLESRHWPRVERALEPARELAGDIGRRDQVKLAVGHGALYPSRRAGSAERNPVRSVTRAMKSIAPLPLLALLAACAGTPLPEPIPDNMPAGLGETVHVGRLVAEPRSVEEDSRCPIDVQCIQAGRVVVNTRLNGDGWTETVPLTLGEAYATHGTTVTVVSVRPDKYSARDIPRAEYRFIFDGGD